MDKTLCFICGANLPVGPIEEKHYFCEEHGEDFFPVCETCADDFDESNCKFCEKQGKLKKKENNLEEIKINELEINQETKIQEQSKLNEQANINNLTYNSEIKAAYLLPGCSVLFNPKSSMIMNQSQDMKNLVYSSFQIINKTENQYEIIQTGGIENFIQIMLQQQQILASNICQKLIIKENQQIPEIQAEDFPFALHKNRYCHTSELINKDKIIIIGGQSNNKNYLDSCELINLQTNEISDIVSLNKSRSQCSSILINDYIYVFGGLNGFQSQEKSIERLLINNLNNLEKWELIKIQNEDKFQSMAGCVILNSQKNKNELLILGGSDATQSNSNIYSFDINSHSIKIVQQMNENRTYGVAKSQLLNGNEEKIMLMGYDENANLSIESWDRKENSVQVEEIDLKMLQALFVFSKGNFVLLN